MDSFKLTELSVYHGACQKMRELTPVVSLLRRRKLHTVIEIGTMKGGTLWLWCQLAEPDAVIISIDLPKGEFGGGYTVKDMKRFRTYARDKQQLHFIRKDSHQQATRSELVKKLQGRKIDLLFIDGDHRYSGVKLDFKMYAPFVREGGTVLFHDILYHPWVKDCGVDRFWNEIKGCFRHQEFLDEDDDRGWGQWGGMGVLNFKRDAYMRILVKMISESGERDHVPRQRTPESAVLL